MHEKPYNISAILLQTLPKKNTDRILNKSESQNSRPNSGSVFHIILYVFIYVIFLLDRCMYICLYTCPKILQRLKCVLQHEFADISYT